MSSNGIGIGEIERALEKAAREIARQNAELREVLGDSPVDPAVFAKVTAFQPTTPNNPAMARWNGARG